MLNQENKSKKSLLSLLLLSVTLLLVYSNHFHNAFHFDDSHTVVHNVFIEKTSNIPLFFKDGSTFSSLPTNQSYRPLVSTTLAIDYALGNGRSDTFWFHVTSFTIFLIQGWLMYFLFRKLLDIVWKKESNFFASLFAVSWYLFHPANAETVNYIIARSDSLSTMLVILGFVLYQYSEVSRKYFLYIIPVLIGTLTKPPAVMFAPLLFLYILFFEKQASLISILSRKERHKFIDALKAAAPAIILCAAAFIFVQKMEPDTWTPGGSSRFNYMITQPYVIVHYFMTFFLPFRLSADTDWTTFTSVTDVRVFLGVMFILSLITAAIWASLKQLYRPIAFGILWYLIALVPSSSIIPLAEVMNDHRLYFPYVGLVLAVTWTLVLLIKRMYYRLSDFNLYKPTLYTISLLLIASYAFGTYRRNEVWKTDESLWKDVTIKSPGNARGLMNYGLSLMGRAQYDEAEKYFLRGLELWPGYSYLHINMGILKESTGKLAEAERYFRNAEQLGPQFPNTYYYYGRFLKNRGRLTEAVPKLRRCLELSPAQVDARSLLMDALFDLQEYEALKKEAEKALQINPADAKALTYLDAGVNKKSKIQILTEKVDKEPTAGNYLDLSMEYYKAGKYPETIAAAQRALELKPESAEAYNNMAAAYGALGQWQMEIDMCKKALEINPNLEIARNNMKWAQSQLDKENAAKQE